jgi:hypothetical protein
VMVSEWQGRRQQQPRWMGETRIAGAG